MLPVQDGADTAEALCSCGAPVCNTSEVLTPSDIAQFLESGFVCLPGAFSRSDAEEGRAILWRDTGCNPDDPRTWTRPVVRLGLYAEAPFARAVNTPRIHAAFDQLVGLGRWLPRVNLGTFPVRFPSWRILVTPAGILIPVSTPNTRISCHGGQTSDRKAGRFSCSFSFPTSGHPMGLGALAGSRTR
jgi:hypothetical protein